MINVSSHCATLPLPGLAVYAASKAGLQAWSDALRVEWAKYGIAVISLVPGIFTLVLILILIDLQMGLEKPKTFKTYLLNTR